MTTTLPRRRAAALVALLAALVLSAPACSAPPSRLDEKFRHSISETFEEPPSVVVDLVDTTVEALRLRIMSRALTSIDGRFEVRSAMGDEYRVVVEGLRTDRTRVAIDMTNRRLEEQAQLILTEISSRIRSLRAASSASAAGT